MAGSFVVIDEACVSKSADSTLFGTLAEMTDAVDEFEAKRWEEEGWQRERGAYVDRLKGRQAQLTTSRLANFEWARSIAVEVENAYDVLDPDELRKAIGGTLLARQLSTQGVRTQKGSDPLQTGGDQGKAWANALIHETDAALIDEAVLECRTLMTAQCLSANFDAKQLGQMEALYIKIISEAVRLGRRLRRERELDTLELERKARDEAIMAANRQRKEKPPVTMAARERYWRDRPAPVRKIFEE